MARGHQAGVAVGGRGRRIRAGLAIATFAAAGFVAVYGGGSAAPAATPLSLTEQGPKLSGAGEIGRGAFGFSVAVSGDGSTAIVGAPQDKNGTGAAWIFVRSGEGWVPQGGKLTGAGEVGHGYFGISVALSDDGDSALIGSPKDGKGFGAAYVFTRSGETWTQESKFTGSEEVGHANFGRRVALSSDGQTALLGGYADNENDGAAWVFVRSGENWVQQGPKLTGTAEAGAGQFGADVALSADGDSALIGGPTDAGGPGAIWFFARSGESWALQGSKVTATGESGSAELGRSVSLAGDGTTAVAGGPGNGAGAGAAWVFTEAGEGWSQSAELAPGLIKGKGGAFGTDVSIAGDGETILAGEPKAKTAVGGAAWVFTLQAGEWSRQSVPLTGGGATKRPDFGRSVSLSDSGTSAFVGGPKDHKAGAVWAFGE